MVEKAAAQIEAYPIHVRSLLICYLKYNAGMFTECLITFDLNIAIILVTSLSVIMSLICMPMPSGSNILIHDAVIAETCARNSYMRLGVQSTKISCYLLW